MGRFSRQADFRWCKKLAFNCLAVGASIAAYADIPLVVNHQGFVRVNGAPFTGTGTFKFGIIDGSGNYVWTNDGTKVGQAAGLLVTPNAPTNGVSLDVAEGNYSVGLGNVSVPNMTALSTDVFSGDTAILRIFFNDGINGERAMGDEAITSSAYAYHAAHADTATEALGIHGYMSGGVISNSGVDAINDLFISEGLFRSDDESGNIRITDMFKQVDLPWAPGSNAGGWDGAVALPNTQTVIYVWAIGDSTGANPGDVLFSVSGNAPSLPAGYNMKRLLGGRVWNGAAWTAFTTLGEGRSRWVFFRDYSDATVFNGVPPSDYTDLNFDSVVPVTTSRFAHVTARADTADGEMLLQLRANGSGDTSERSTWAYVFSSSTENNSSLATTFPVFLDGNGIIEWRVTSAAGSNVNGWWRVRAYLENL